MSDATGETATRVVMAVERQFPSSSSRTSAIRGSRAPTTSSSPRSRARGRRAVVVYTLSTRSCATRCARAASATASTTATCSATRSTQWPGSPACPPKGEPGALPVLDSSYFRAVEAIEFAVQADDGVAATRLREADVVLVGVSRTSKTPLSIYLGYLGYKAANVPIVKGIDPPRRLWEVEPGEGRGCHAAAELLAEIRGAAGARDARLDAGLRRISRTSTRSSISPRRSSGGSAAP